MIFHFFALAAVGIGISGGDRIFIELARHWAEMGHQIHIYVWKDGAQIIKNWNLSSKNIHIHIVKMGIWPKLGFLINYFARIAAGIHLGLSLNVDPKSVVYSASDFWMDSFPAILIKFRLKKIKWVAGWYQTSPNPLVGFSEGKRLKTYRVTALLYWISQLVIKPFVERYSDLVLVNNESEKAVFRLKNSSSIHVVLGAVDLDNVNTWISKHKRGLKKTYSAVFQGRFHPQKGVVELIDIWKKVILTLPDAKLAMIGDGELRPDVEQAIARAGLSSKIHLYGFLYDGPKKFEVFSHSRVVVHPAFFDSGGMATAEAMAFGLPAVGFNLKSYLSYYPSGMLKVPVGDLDSFADSVALLIKDKKLYVNYSKDAQDMIQKNWSWTIRAQEVLKKINELS